MKNRKTEGNCKDRIEQLRKRNEELNRLEKIVRTHMAQQNPNNGSSKGSEKSDSKNQ